MTKTTFAKWRESGEPDPHGDFYSGSLDKLAHANLPCEILAEILIRLDGDFTNIGYLTAGKERLRWLSRKLYKLTKDHDVINQKRASKLRGDLTDDELANTFFISESIEDLTAGRERILWLKSEIKQLT